MHIIFISSNKGPVYTLNQAFVMSYVQSKMIKFSQSKQSLFEILWQLNIEYVSPYNGAQKSLMWGKSNGFYNI